jgi:hypothetical protein
MICNRGLKISRLGGDLLKTDLVDKQHELHCSPDATHIRTPQESMLFSCALVVGSESRLSLDTVAGCEMKCGDVPGHQTFHRNGRI